VIASENQLEACIAMPSASYLAAYTTVSIAPADRGRDGTQSPEIRNSPLAVAPPSGSSPRSPQPGAWPTPLGAWRVGVRLAGQPAVVS
jgi:hypothetical protein